MARKSKYEHSSAKLSTVLWKPALYIRLSREDGDREESNSIASQRLMLQKYAEEHCFPNIQFYMDDGFSGADFNRPDFKRMMNDVECGKVWAIAGAAVVAIMYLIFSPLGIGA